MKTLALVLIAIALITVSGILIAGTLSLPIAYGMAISAFAGSVMTAIVRFWRKDWE